MIATQVASEEQPLQILCWQCSRALAFLNSAPAYGAATYRCNHCGALTRSTDGIWQAMAPDRIQYFSQFKSDYESIRAAEGRGSDDPDYYLALPFCDISGRNREQWRIRSVSFRYIEEHILSPLASAYTRPLRIFDLGAGNGWMSYRIALRGHSPVAVDLLRNHHDGLGACTHFSLRLHSLFPRVQAELDRLPFPSSSADVTLFNASFHYSENYHRTLTEAIRCTRPGGIVLIADTPLYQNEASGERMVEEKHKRFLETYGTSSNSIATLEYLTPQRLAELQRSLGLRWNEHRPSYDLRWVLRPLRAKLRGDRPPSQFRIYSAVVNQ
jgi:SAM-dependent methyltransferase